MSLKILLAAAIAAAAAPVGIAARLAVDAAGTYQSDAIQVSASAPLYRAGPAAAEAPGGAQCLPTSMGAHGPAAFLRISLCGAAPDRPMAWQ